MNHLTYLTLRQLPKKQPKYWQVKNGSAIYYEGTVGLCNYYKKLHNLTSAAVRAVY